MKRWPPADDSRQTRKSDRERALRETLFSEDFRRRGRSPALPPSMSPARKSSFEVRVPASTANLGAGFDCLGLALEIYLSVRASLLGSSSRTVARSSGVRGTSQLPKDPEQNLIFRAMRLTAEREGFALPRVRVAVQNQIPVAGGLGSSAAAAVAGIALGFAVAGGRSTKTPRCVTQRRWKAIPTTSPPRCSADWW